MKIRHITWETLSAATADELQEAIETFQEDAGEKEFIDLTYQVDGGTHYVLIAYSE